MLFRITLSTLVALLLAGGIYYTSFSSQQELPSYTKKQRIDEAYAQEFEKTRDLATNTVPSERLVFAKQEADFRAAGGTSGFAPIPGITWEERGPSNVGGRTRAMLYDANDPSGETVFAGSVGGGLWRTTDITAASPNWTPINEFWTNIAISSIAQDPNTPNTIYVGTGEGWFNADAIRGNGIWKSTDGGASFTQLASTTTGTFRYVNKVVVGAAGVVLASVRSNAGGSGGVYRSTDGGTSWTRTLSSTGTSISPDMEVAANGDIYAAMGFAFTYSDGIYRSTDNGLSWSNVYDATTNGEGRIDIACAPSDPNTLYALLEVGGGADIRRSNDNGATWTLLPQPVWDEGGPFTRGQEWYDLAIAVDPNNAATVFIGGVDLFRSTNSGNSWTQISKWYSTPSYPYAHADQHFIVFKPGSSTEVLFGNDGGVFRSTDAGNSFSTRSTNYNVTQFYACAISNEAGVTRFLAGSQDNGSHRYLDPGINATTEVTGGDGAFCHIDEDNPNIQITSYVYNYYWITSNAWASRSTITIGSGTGRFINPTDYDSDANILYGAHDNDEYSYITGVGSSNTTGTRSVPTFGGEVSAVTASPVTANRVFFGIGNGQIVRVDNAHDASFVATSLGSPAGGGYVSSIAVDRSDDNHLLATFSNYGINSIWETTDGGTSWTSVEGDLPDMPVRWAEFNPNNTDQAVIATELGVWTTDNLNAGATSWGPSNTNLANVRTDMLQFRPSDNFLIAATHGRGLYSTTHFQQIPEANFLCSTLGTLTVTGTVVDISGVVVQNNGAGSTGSTANIGFYLSLDATITTGDFLIGTDVIPVLASGGTSAHSLNVDVSTLGLPAGTYYIGYFIDNGTAIPEVDENDNACGWTNPMVTIACSSTPSNCINNNSITDSTIGQSDGYINYLGSSFGTGYTGGEDVIEFTTTGGNVTFTLSGLGADLDLILMTDCDVNSTFLAESVNGGTSNETITINLAAGTYYLFVDGWSGATSNYNLDVNCAGVSVRPKVFLQGPLVGGLMNDDIRSAGILPSTEPYGSGLSESMTTGVSSATGGDAIVDWVQVELRDAGSPTTVVATRSALVQRDGDVVDVDGISAVKFPGVAAGNYYVVIKHRNHLSVMTSTAIPLS